MANAVFYFLSPQPTTSAMLTISNPNFFPLKHRYNIVSFLLRRKNPTRLYCNCSERYRVKPEYADAFSRRMSSVALKPHHRIAMGVSGGADSMALCALMANWKTCSNNAGFDSSGFANGLLAIVVDHGLRLESKEESETVSHLVSDLGIRCKVVSCNWPDGLPKVGHLEEAARDMRYQIFQDVCSNNRIDVLLTAHHADDQAELFVLRLSRNSGILGLAGMASTSQIFPNFSKFTVESSNSAGILLIRPLLDFYKEDMYKICKNNNQKWVEDPSNRSSLFARNRIRIALQDLNSGVFRSELQALVAICRQTRLYVDHVCQCLLKEAVTILPLGYAVIDLERLNPRNKPEICLSKILAIILQYISQRHRPVRGSASTLLLQYIRSFPCKTSLTLAGCYLCPLPGSKGTKVIICCSFESSSSANTELYFKCRIPDRKQHIPHDLEQIIMDQKSETKYLVPNPSDVHLLNNAASFSILNEARRLEIISETTCESITKLQAKEKHLFKSKKEVISSNESKNDENSSPFVRERFRPGESIYFMNRFFLTWNIHHKGESCNLKSCMCKAGDVGGYIRLMIDEDWLYLANLSKACDNGMEKLSGEIILCTNHAKLSAEKALRVLKPIPVAVRRSLPVIVNSEGILLSIPSIGINHCPSMIISAEFRPRIPVGGGHSSFM